MTHDAVYQRLRSHLAYLKLTSAAEVLAAKLDRAQKDKPSTPRSWRTCSPPRSPPPSAAGWPGACGSPTFRWSSAWRTSISTPSPPLDRFLLRAILLAINGDSYGMRAHRERLQMLRAGLGGAASSPMDGSS